MFCGSYVRFHNIDLGDRVRVVLQWTQDAHAHTATWRQHPSHLSQNDRRLRAELECLLDKHDIKRRVIERHRLSITLTPLNSHGRFKSRCFSRFD